MDYPPPPPPPAPTFERYVTVERPLKAKVISCFPQKKLSLVKENGLNSKIEKTTRVLFQIIEYFGEISSESLWQRH